MENFFYDGEFFSDLEELMDYEGIKTEADVYGLPIDWHVKAEYGEQKFKELPGYYYPSGKYFVINRNHLFEYIR